MPCDLPALSVVSEGLDRSIPWGAAALRIGGPLLQIMSSTGLNLVNVEAKPRFRRAAQGKELALLALSLEHFAHDEMAVRAALAIAASPR
jgi:hypothetical protein